MPVKTPRSARPNAAPSDHARPEAASSDATPDAAPLPLAPDERDILQALALAWSPCTRTRLHALLRGLDRVDANGRPYTHEHLRATLPGLHGRGWIVEDLLHKGSWQIAPDLRPTLYLQALDRDRPQALLDALSQSDSGSAGPAYLKPENIFYLPSDRVAALARVLFHQGLRPEEVVHRLHLQRMGRERVGEVLNAALFDGLHPALFARLHPDLRHEVALPQLARLGIAWDPSARPMLAAVQTLLDTEPATATNIALRVNLRLTVAEFALLAGRAEQGREQLHRLAKEVAAPPAGVSQEQAIYLQSVAGAASVALEAAQAVIEGRFAAAAEGFERALPALQKAAGKRKGLLSQLIDWLYPLSLLAQQTPAHLAKALRVCLTEAGRRTPLPESAHGSMALAIRMRTGEAPRELKVFEPLVRPVAQAYPPDFWNWLMRAWLTDASDRRPLTAKERAAARQLRERLAACDLGWMAAQLDAALAVLDGEPAPPAFFVPPAQERWRTTLAALAALGSDTAEPGVAATQAASVRIVWQVTLDAHGRVEAIEPFEQRHGARGWSKPKPLTLAKIAGSERLEPWDARVARTIRHERHSGRKHRLDRAAAIVALVGHPAVALADAPGRFIDLVEAAPTIELVRHRDALQLRVTPAIHDTADDGAGEDAEALGFDRVYPRFTSVESAEERKEAEALRLVSVLRDSPQRARVVRLTPAQRRAAQLLAKPLVVPRAARAELDATLRALAAHFEVQADAAADAAADVPADAANRAGTDSPAAASLADRASTVPAQTRLRAELSPHGEGLALRLVAVPLGPDGPRVAPGSGRPRLIAAVRGVTLATQRDLDAERAHLAAVIEACPMLGAEGSEWTVDRADDALALLEALPALPAVAGLDWPKGKPVEVLPAGPGQLRLKLRGAGAWFALRGGLRIDEREVVQLDRLLEWSLQGKGRFVPLGEGRYLALTQELRARLDALAAVAELSDGEARFAEAAAPWLQETLDGTALEADRTLRARLERLDEARAAPAVALPGGLQATLRPYQEEGFAWAARLAQAGFGAVLADDMGLGKTLQALALLLWRAPQGPALVVAPTSLGANWQAEARRFAPALRVRIYGDEGADRAALLARPGPFDVVIASYQLVQQAADAFAAPAWHTLVVDEAQAVKNADAKRSQALFGLQADFRIALSGTPIENRLAELWSIMRLCNPGLLGPIGRFNQRFATPIERHRDRDAQRTLRRLVAPFVLRRTKAQVLDDLPPRTELTLAALPEPDEAAHYEALRRRALAEAEKHLAGSAAGQAHVHVLAQLMRLRRAACDPRLVTPELGIVGAKVRAFAALAAELAANGHKTLVFSQFVDFLALLREPLDAAGLRWQYLDGATPAAERARRVAAFQAGEGDFFLISLKAGGFGLNLTAADYVVIADPWWNPAAEDQAMGRAHRIGQQRPVTAYRLVTRGTLEEGIVALHHDKRALAEGMLGGGEGAVLPSTEELVALVRGDRRG